MRLSLQLPFQPVICVCTALCITRSFVSAISPFWCIPMVHAPVAQPAPGPPGVGAGTWAAAWRRRRQCSYHPDHGAACLRSRCAPLACRWMVLAAPPQSVCVQSGLRACPRRSPALQSVTDRSQLADRHAACPPAALRPAAAASRAAAPRCHRPAAASRVAAPRSRVRTAASAAAMAKIPNFKVAIFSAQSFVEDFLKEPLEKVIAADHLKVSPGRQRFFCNFLGFCTVAEAGTASLPCRGLPPGSRTCAGCHRCGPSSSPAVPPLACLSWRYCCDAYVDAKVHRLTHAAVCQAPACCMRLLHWLPPLRSRSIDARLCRVAV